MIDTPRTLNALFRQRRRTGLFLAFGLCVGLYVSFCTQSCGAQTGDQTDDQSQYPPTWQTQDDQSGQGQYPSQNSTQYPNQGTGTYSGQSTGPYSNQNQGQGQYSGDYSDQYDEDLYSSPDMQMSPTEDQYGNQEPGQTQGQQPNQQNQQNQPLYPMQNQQQYRQSRRLQNGQQNRLPLQPVIPGSIQALGLDTLSADQLISLLSQKPDVLEYIRAYLIRRSQVRDSNIPDEPLTLAERQTKLPDERVYELVRQDASLRELVIREMMRRGYRADLLALKNNSLKIPRVQPQSQEPPEPPPYDNPDNPQVQRRDSPYEDMASMRDLYAQFPARAIKLRRFGSDAFLNGTPASNRLTADLPAGPDYVLGAGDMLTVNMWGGQSSRLNRIVDRQGQISLPEVGAIMIDGKTIAQAQEAIQRALDTQFRGEHVELSLGRVRTVRVYVVGDVQRPGAYDVSSLSTPLNALYEAGGPTSRGSLRILRQLRGGQLVRQIDLYDFFLHGVRSNDERLQAGDTVLVPPAGPQVTVEGAVRRPAVYELNGDQSLSQVLELAGGVLVSGSLKQVDVGRIDAHQSRTMFSLQLPDNTAEAQPKLAAFELRDGDDVKIKQILPYNQQSVYLEGHVIHPGKYPYKEGMTLADLIRSYQDLMPEPADRGELIRLRAPDFRPEATTFNVPEVLVGNESIPLHPFDLVRIYGRYEVDSPMVTIDGDVLRPGKYPMAKGMSATDLIMLAGGFRRSAYRAEADLSSYVIENGKSVLTKHSEIDLQKALAGDQSSNLALKPGDVLSIRRLAGWQDIGATVTVSGEVEHPGSYGIEEGERLSSILKRAGGFRQDAYPYAAVLQRDQVRELNLKAREQMIRQLEETPVVVSPGTMTMNNQTVEDMQKSLEAQRTQVLMNLRSAPISGRLVINIASDISKWENTPADIVLRAGDVLVVPKRPDFVMASGQVYNPVAISYVPGKKLDWYYKKAGGATSSGNKKSIYVLRADGSVIPCGRGLLGSGLSDVRMRPGDTIFVPQKIIGGSQLWQNIVSTAQVMSAAALPFAFAGII